MKRCFNCGVPVDAMSARCRRCIESGEWYPQGTIGVDEEVQVPSVVEDMIEMDRVQDLRDQVQAAGVIWVEDELRVKKCRKNCKF